MNGGNGINEWSEADINTLLNDYYYNRKANQKCFNAENNSAIDCDFSRHGLSEKSKNYIGDAIWHLGSNGSQAAFNGINTSNFYLMERSSTSGKICPTATYCNDGLKREATWTGIIGLMYPSDYGYATSGGSATNRLTCLNNVLYNWYTTNIKDCKNNNWLEKENKEQWTIMPLAYSSNASSVFYMDSSKAGSNYLASYSRAINPTLYLLPNVFFTNGIGEVSNPFVVSIE